ncbi:transposase-like zinc-binding domain-containing protein, partial [Hymenobacter rubripertinctus]
MLQTTLTCGKCSSADLRKNGSRHGQPKYQCKACRHQA